jgi:hypothetical protein
MAQSMCSRTQGTEAQNMLKVVWLQVIASMSDVSDACACVHTCIHVHIHA